MSGATPLRPTEDQPPAGAPAAPPTEAPPPELPTTAGRLLLYGAASLCFGVTQGLGSNLVSANLPAVQAAFAATPNEANWLTAAYLATAATASVLLLKFRQQFGVRRFAVLGLAMFVVASVAHLFSRDLGSAVAVRAVTGFAAAPLNTLALLYMAEPLPQVRKFAVGIPLGLIGSQSGPALARLLSPDLLDLDGWHGLTLLEIGLSLLCLAIVLLLPITPPPRVKAFDRVDALSFPAFAAGMGLLAVALTLARLYWWTEAPWLGLCLAGGIALLTVVVVVELNRARPMIDLRWLSAGDMLAVSGSLLLVRVLMASEQNVGAIAKFQNLGFLNEAMRPLFAVILAATVAGYLAAFALYRPGREAAIHAVALGLIALGAWMESGSTSLTHPRDFHLTQAMVAFGGGLFLPTAMLRALRRMLEHGMHLFTSFIAMFLVTQNVGSLLASSLLGTFVTVREKFHSNQIAEGLSLLDPFVAARLAQYGGTYGRVLTDPALRSGEAAVLLGQVATREATVLAYNDLFMLTAALALAALLLLLLHTALARPAAAPAPGAA